MLEEPMGFESASCMETKEFCGATWPSKVLKGMRVSIPVENSPLYRSKIPHP